MSASGTRMQAFAALSMFAIGVVTLLVGGRLLLLARRSRCMPEFAFGLGFVSGSLGTVGGQLGQKLVWADSGAITTWANASCFAFVVMGTVMLYVGIRRIFRPTGSWAAWACALGSALALANYGVRATAGDFPEARLETGGMALFQASRLLLFIWAAAEALHHYRQLQRRIRIGLADPVAAAQILLWGATALAMVATTATIITSLFWIGRHPLEMPLATGLLTIFAFSASALMWCAFFPPEALRRSALANATRA